jgi:hypothetical protein
MHFFIGKALAPVPLSPRRKILHPPRAGRVVAPVHGIRGSGLPESARGDKILREKTKMAEPDIQPYRRASLDVVLF